MIGVFDSGVGGLTVVKEIFRFLPDYQIIYFGDTARLPYGTKGENFVKRSSEKITEWLLSKGAKIIVIACNTSSSWASDSLKKRFRNVPVFEMITPVIKEIESLKEKRIGIIGTPGTIKSQAYDKKILGENPNIEIFSVACPLFVPLAEEGWTEGEITEKIAERYLASFKRKKIKALVLACTHYPLLENSLRRVLDSNIKIINPAKSLGEELKNFLEENPKIERKIKKGNNHQFFFSDKPYNFKKISHLCFNKRLKPVIEDPFQ